MDDGLDFSPFSDAEREAAAQQLARDGEPDGDKPTCPPADAEPPKVAAARLFGRKPDGLWRYASAEGQTMFWVCRYNKPDGGKDFFPLCWFPGEGWRSKHWPRPRPLYNLDRLAARLEAPVIVCEGEKSAEAASRIFADCVATTSSGGAQSAMQTDWTRWPHCFHLAGQ